MNPHDHDHEHGGDERFGMALGFRIFEDAGELYWAEAEVTPYVDEPQALGATLVFHPLEGLDPTDVSEEMDWPAWPVDVDDDLARDTGSPLAAQFASIVRQLAGLSEGQLREYLALAREEAEGTEE